MSARTKKTAATSAPKKPKAAPQAAKLPAKMVPAAVPAKKIPAAVPAKAEAAKTSKPKAAPRKTSMEAMLARVEAVRLAQRAEGHFDCFGRAASGYCDQGGCAFHAECRSVSRLLHSL